MWIVCETLCEIIGGIEEDPHISVSQHEDKYKALNIMKEFFCHESQRDDLGELCWAKYDNKKMMAKICFEQTVIVIFARKVGDNTEG